jgi:hypothetical protein
MRVIRTRRWYALPRLWWVTIFVLLLALPFALW